jgi:hypothetical protein
MCALGNQFSLPIFVLVMLKVNCKKIINVKILICILLSLNTLDVKSQLKDPALSVSVMPTVSNRLMSFKTNVSNNYKDSINRIDGYRDAISAAVMLSYSVDKYTRIHFGLQYLNLGFTRKKENLRFLDTIHPQIGIMSDLSQTGESYVDFNYRFHYITLPFLVDKQIVNKSMKASTLHFILGASISALLKHDINAQFHGFSLKGGEKSKVLDASNQEAGRLNGNFQVGFRLENLVYGEKTFVFVQPNLFIPVLKANYSKERAQLYALGLQVGLMFKLEKDKQ